ncbi:MAG: VPGUxxT family thioredoxin-like (seleno)protein, type 2, partial [Saprospiraceae bacterium]
MVQYILPAILLMIAVFALPSFISSELEHEHTIAIEKVRPDQPEELGAVNWQRDFEQSFKAANRTGKPVFILFQEVPGCSTCRNYGNNVLSHPLIVEAIETLFVPVVVHNNKGGKDAEMLKYFGEPSWNNPVVRIVNSDKKDVLPRLNGNYSAAGLVDYMLRGLDLYNQVAPQYLELLQEELGAELHGTERATVSMYCFWSGEGKLGAVDGVVGTKAGWMDGKEVVQIDYNPQIISYTDLIETAKNAQCASYVYTENAQQKSA